MVAFCFYDYLIHDTPVLMILILMDYTVPEGMVKLEKYKQS